ncbi:MAG: DNA polymerase III subunit delta [Phycisphaerales bacterium]|nr:DNA polymerase III subunit delta [Phycisphaerales bacterium]
MSSPPPLDAGIRVLVLHGQEEFLRNEHLRRLETVLEETHGGYERFDFDGRSTDVATVLDELRSYGLMQAHKLVVVDAADEFLSAGADGRGGAGARQSIERYAEAPMEQATLVLRAGRWNRGKLDSMVQKVGQLIKCDEPTDGQAAAWCVARANKQYSAVLDRDAATLLVERIGTNLTRLDTEVGKLLSAAPGDTPRITRDMVVELVGMSREEAAWELQSALLEHGAPGGLRMLRQLREVSRTPDVLITWALVDLARKLHDGARLLAAGRPEGAVAKVLRLWGPGQVMVLSTARKLGPRQAATMLQDAIGTVEAMRSGRAGGPDRTLEAMVVRMADTVR